MSMINLLNEQSDPDSVKNDSGPIELTKINLAPIHKKSLYFWPVGAFANDDMK